MYEERILRLMKLSSTRRNSDTLKYPFGCVGVSSSLAGKGELGFVSEGAVLVTMLSDSGSVEARVGDWVDVCMTVQRYKANEHALASFLGPSLDMSLVWNTAYGVS